MKIKFLPFVNAVEMHKQHPDTFEIPSKNDLLALKKGDFVKVCLQDDNRNGERFWCQVTSIDKAQRKIIASVDNELVFYPEIELGLEVKFDFNNVYAIYQ